MGHSNMGQEPLGLSNISQQGWRQAEWSPLQDSGDRLLSFMKILD
jgi:hypothetical protein